MAYEDVYRRSIEQPEAYWAEQAEAIHWQVPPQQILEYDKPPFRQWFVGGETNLCYNAVDRHLAERGDQLALVGISTETHETRELTYRDLYREVNTFAAVLQSLDVQRGDRVVIYMGMVPEAAIAMLACARIGAVHSVIFGGFAADAVRDRIIDAGATTVITQDGARRRGKVVALKAQVDKALESCPEVARTIVLRRTGNEITMAVGRDLEWADVLEGVSDEHEAPALAAEHPLRHGEQLTRLAYLANLLVTAGHPDGNPYAPVEAGDEVLRRVALGLRHHARRLAEAEATVLLRVGVDGLFRLGWRLAPPPESIPATRAPAPTRPRSKARRGAGRAR